MSNDVFKQAKRRNKGQAIAQNFVLDDPEITMQAKYLLIQFCSHSEEWKIQMPDIVKRSKNGRTAHYNALTELILNKYVARIKVLEKGVFRKQIYIFGQDKQDVAEDMQEVVKTETVGDFTCRVEFGEPVSKNLNTDAPNSSDIPEPPFSENPNTDVPNADSWNNINNQGRNSQTEIPNTIDIGEAELDDDKERINLIISILREETREDLTDRSFKSVLKKVMDKHNQGKVGNFRDYFVTSLVNKIEALELRRLKEGNKSKGEETRATSQAMRSDAYSEHLHSLENDSEYVGKITFYNWLEN